jgi:hypothetical protein
MAQNPWLLLAPLVLMFVAFGVHFSYFSLGDSIDNPLSWIALITTIAFMVWACVGSGKDAGAVAE